MFWHNLFWRHKYEMRYPFRKCTVCGRLEYHYSDPDYAMGAAPHWGKAYAGAMQEWDKLNPTLRAQISYGGQP